MDPEPTITNAKKLMIVDDDADMRTLLAEDVDDVARAMRDV